ncbi:MAG TPA: hypothetical protein DEB74_04735 [Lachnospiraceae bacterium]|nr:hypothetical protein [Lachnospiraceae bacterium]
MNQRLFDTLRKIGNLPLIRLIKPTVSKLFDPYGETKRNKLLHENGIRILDDFNAVMSRSGINYSLIFGTLLGAVREHGFIKHDLDIDVAVWKDTDHKYIQAQLISNGYTLKSRYEVDNGNFGREETYIKDGVSIDIFYFYPYNDTLAYTIVLVPFDGNDTFEESIRSKGGLMPIQLILPFSQKTKTASFHNLSLPIIENDIEFLEARYGENWRIPDPTFVYPKMGDAKCAYRSDKLAIKLT